MTSKFKTQKHTLLFFGLCFTTLLMFSQRETNRWKAQVALGVSNPSQAGFVEGFEGKPNNFPTVNLGVQHMFKKQWGAKLDYGFSRITNKAQTQAFKLNYSRLNVQLVYDPTSTMYFLPKRMGVVTHLGPGYTFVKPLGFYKENKTSFFNAMGGVEVHYAVSQRLSLYLDASYIYAMAKAFKTPQEGAGAFNGALFTTTFGITFSLSGCQYCN